MEQYDLIFIENMEENGVIFRVDQPTDWCAGMVVVPEPNNKIPICVDLIHLNEMSNVEETIVLGELKCNLGDDFSLCQPKKIGKLVILVNTEIMYAYKLITCIYLIIFQVNSLQ